MTVVVDNPYDQHADSALESLLSMAFYYPLSAAKKATQLPTLVSEQTSQRWQCAQQTAKELVPGVVRAKVQSTLDSEPVLQVCQRLYTQLEALDITSQQARHRLSNMYQMAIQRGTQLMPPTLTETAREWVGKGQVMKNQTQEFINKERSVVEESLQDPQRTAGTMAKSSVRWLNENVSPLVREAVHFSVAVALNALAISMVLVNSLMQLGLGAFHGVFHVLFVMMKQYRDQVRSLLGFGLNQAKGAYQKYTTPELKERVDHYREVAQDSVHEVYQRPLVQQSVQLTDRALQQVLPREVIKSVYGMLQSLINQAGVAHVFKVSSRDHLNEGSEPSTPKSGSHAD